VVLADDRRCVAGRELDLRRRPAPRHADVAEGIGPHLLVEPGKEPERVVPRIDHQRQTVAAGERLAVRTTRGERVAADRRGDEHEVRPPRPRGPGVKAAAGRSFRSHPVFEGLDGDQGAEAVGDDRQRLIRRNPSEKPAQIMAVGMGPFILRPAVPEQQALLLAGPGEDHRAHRRTWRAAGRRLAVELQALRLCVPRLVAVAMDEDLQRPAGIVEQARQIGPLPAAAGRVGAAFDREGGGCGGRRDAGQPAGAHHPDVGRRRTGRCVGTGRCGGTRRRQAAGRCQQRQRPQPIRHPGSHSCHAPSAPTS
jgi:hypothetical protein